jgi:hypothetical protein
MRDGPGGAAVSGACQPRAAGTSGQTLPPLRADAQRKPTRGENHGHPPGGSGPGRTRRTQNERARLPIQDKISYLKQIRHLVLTHAPRRAGAETKAKQLTPGLPLAGGWGAELAGVGAESAHRISERGAVSVLCETGR